MTSHKKQLLSPHIRQTILAAFKIAKGDGSDITPSQLAESIRWQCQSQEFYPVPSQRIVNKYLRDLGFQEKTLKVWIIPKRIPEGEK